MNTGTIKFFLADKGYGFIVNDMDGLEYFFHIKHCYAEPKKGDKVKFGIESTKCGPQAQDVKKSYDSIV